MIKEKSCGAVVYKIINNQYYFLIEKMKRQIREGIACHATYRFQIRNRTIFWFETDKAAFEYEYNR